MPSRNSPSNAAMQPGASRVPVRSATRSVAAAAVGGVALLLSVHLPPALVLPFLSAVLVAGGMGLAAVAWLRGTRTEHGRTGSYEVAGALVFLGFAAALLADSDQALALFEELQTKGLTAAR